MTEPHHDLPATAAPASGAGSDLARQIVVVAATAYMIFGAVIGSGMLGGTPVQDLQGGALSEQGSLLAPAGPAFAIWSVIYAGTVAYAVWQALPAQHTRPRQRAIGWWIAATAVLNGSWILLAQFTTLVLTVVCIVLLLIALCVTFRRTVSVPSDSLLDMALIDGVVGLHLGWVSLATVANISAWLAAEGPQEWHEAGELLGIIVLALVGVIGVAVAVTSRWRITPGLAMAWGLSWIAVGRLTGDPHSTPVGVTAVIVASIVILVPAIGWTLRRAAEARSAGA